MAKLKKLLMASLSCLPFVSGPSFSTEPVLNHTLEAIAPKQAINLSETYAGKVLVVVNIASACGFTSQLKELEDLYQKYKDQGLVVLGFPSNDFFQERKEGDDIVEFCRLNYGVTFPLFKKSSVRGSKANPFYQDLIKASGGKSPKWNFFKYLVDADQKVVGFYSSTDKPLGGDLERKIKSLLKPDS